MAAGIVATLDELISYKKYAQKKHYHRLTKNLRAGSEYYSKLRGRGMDFAEARNYQAGDEIRHMEWKSTARTGRPHVKLYQEERERPVLLLCDFNQSMYFGTRVAFKSVVAARLAAMLAWTAITQGDKVGGLLFSATSHAEFLPRGRYLGVMPLLAALSQYTSAISEDHNKSCVLSDALMRLRRVIKPGSVIIIISDFTKLDMESERHLGRLRFHNDILLYHVCDPLELAPPKPHHYPITDGQQEIILDTTNKIIARRYQDYCTERIGSLKALCKRLQISYTQVIAKDNIPQLVWQTFPSNFRV